MLASPFTWGMSRSILYACILSILLYQFFDYYLNIEDDDDPPVYSGIARGATANRTGAGENVNASKYALRSAIVLGFPLTGTADLARALNSFPQVYLVDDIVQKGDVGQYSDRRIISHLSSALSFPKDKISASSFLGLSTTKRFFREFFGSYKFSVRLKLVGFTLNPFYVSENALVNLIDRNPDAKIIVMKRHNLVKLAVASYLAKVARGGHGKGRRSTDAGGGSSSSSSSPGSSRSGKSHENRPNLSRAPLESGYKDLPCSKQLHHTIPWNISSFLTEVIDSKKRYDAYLDRIASLNRSVHVVYFEDMQINLETVVEKLFDYVGCSELYWPEFVANTASVISGASSESHSTNAAPETTRDRRESGCIPTIEEDLSSVLVNFHNIRNGLLKRLKKVDRKRGAGQILTSLIASAKTDSPLQSSPSSSALYCILQQLEARGPNATFSFC